MKTKILGLLAVSVVGGLLMGGSVEALTIDGTCTVGTGTSVRGAASGTFSCQQFDPSLGTLVGIGYTISASATGSTTLVNGSSSAATGTGDTYIDFVVDGPDVYFSDQEFDGIGSLTLQPGASITQAFNESTGTTGTIDPSAFSMYTGLGSALFNWSGYNSSTTVPGSNGLSASSTAFFSFTGNLVYTYESFAVPEPGTLALLGLGLTGLALSRKRKAH